MTPKERVHKIREKVKADSSKYSSLDDWIAAICEEYHRQLLPSPGDLGGLLFSIHRHAKLNDDPDEDEEIIYREGDIIELLKTFGFPEPVWGKVVNMKDYEHNSTDKPEVST